MEAGRLPGAPASRRAPSIFGSVTNALLALLLGIPGFALAIVLHELAHAWVADRLGDPTARHAGRISLDPRRHFDPAGALVYVISVVFLRFGFGWAKPVPINAWNFRDRRAGMALTGIAGPLANFLQAWLWVGLLQVSLRWLGSMGLVAGMMFYGFTINVVLMVFNLVPIPPLDGSRVLAWMLPERAAQQLDRMEPFGMALVLLLLVGFGFTFLDPVLQWVFGMFQWVLRLFL